MNLVATSAGVTKPVLYQHFASKRDLFRAVLDDIGVRLERDVLEAALKAGTPREQVENGFAAYLRFVETDADGFRLLFAGTSREDDEWVTITQRVERSIAQGIADLINVPGMSQERRISLAHGVVGLAEGMVRHALAEPSPSPDITALAKDLTSLAWGGLRGLGGPPA
jgi:AcrR family transcriptional regulator